ncbi:hypothetical protein C8R43DRAFT_944115 [Mycena crocata]|nr:hypothetical protein C8R43DRAFT_944115 [Mycena crocata]
MRPGASYRPFKSGSRWVIWYDHGSAPDTSRVMLLKLVHRASHRFLCNAARLLPSPSRRHRSPTRPSEAARHARRETGGVRSVKRAEASEHQTLGSRWDAGVARVGLKAIDGPWTVERSIAQPRSSSTLCAAVLRFMMLVGYSFMVLVRGSCDNGAGTQPLNLPQLNVAKWRRKYKRSTSFPWNHSPGIIPLESDPSLFTQLIDGLGVHSLEFQDVLSLDSTDLVPTGCFALPEPVYALILIYPTPENYEAQLAAERREGTPYAGCGLGEPVIWFDQTIHNACGLYAILHAVSNIGPTYIGIWRSAMFFSTDCAIDPNSVLGEFIPSCVGLDPTERAAALEASVGIADAYRAVAMQGGTPVPRAEDEVDFHYVCFVKSPLDGHLYEMDGDRNGPLDRGDGEILSGGLELAKSFIQQGNARFQLMALVPKTA